MRHVSWVWIVVFGVLGCAEMDDGSARGEAVVASGSELVGDFSAAQVTGDIDVTGASLVGVISNVSVAHHATEVTSSREGATAVITVVTATRAGVGMAQVTIADTAVLAEDGPLEGIEIVACSGPESWAWDFDGNAENVVLSVERDAADPEVVTLAFSADIVEFDAFFHPDEDGYAMASEEEIANIPTTRLSGEITLALPSPKE